MSDELENERAEFEAEMYRLYLDKRCAGQIDPSQDGDGSPEALFWRQPGGAYGVLMFNAAWYGWKAAKGLV